MSYPVISHHITSYHITSYHITSHHITSHHITKILNTFFSLIIFIFAKVMSFSFSKAAKSDSPDPETFINEAGTLHAVLAKVS
jgi:hypothetical protein